MKFFMLIWKFDFLLWNWKDFKLKDSCQIDRPAASEKGHDQTDKPGLALEHDRKDKDGPALGHREDADKPNVDDAHQIEVPLVEDTIDACAAENVLIVGTDLDETINGRCGNDELYGSSGDDMISGGGGHDYLSGNQGDDILIGGEGADTFSFDGNFDEDTVLDFSFVDGDSIDFIVYEDDRSYWTPETIADLFVQTGTDAVLRFPGSDEAVILSNVDASQITADIITLTNYAEASDLISG